MNSLWKPGTGGPSRMAEGIALHRFAESMLPEDIRLFSDPYAIRFLDPVKVAWAKDHPAETKAMGDEIERKMPGWSNAIRGRIRYFDDVVGNAVGEGFSQLVILGAGYDTRAYRIGTLKGQLRVFEIDRPETVERKTRILTEIFGTLPDHVVFVPLDIGQGPSWSALEAAGFSPAKKTLFLLEGLVMYLPRTAVDNLLDVIAQQAGAGSAILFDFLPQALADGSSDAEGGQAIRDWTIMIGEPIQSGFAEGEVVPYLTGHGFSGVQVISSRAFAKMYFTGKKVDRNVSGQMSIAYARVPCRGGEHQ
ncbi:MAG: class I SAM-dependent methyltransferase [Methanoregula sp.]|nr:class I SAM-dependent methyltransferase [Methanoregula sp.]